MSQKNILITGVNRGLGLGLTEHYLREGHRVFGLTRKKQEPELSRLSEKNPGKLIIFEADICSKEDLMRTKEALLKDTTALDIIINNAGRYGSNTSALADPLDEQELTLTFKTNVIGPLWVAHYFVPLLKKGHDKKLVHISTLMASMADNQAGGSYPYRLSKTALNMANKNLSIELKADGIISLALHPGWVKTDMGGAQAPLDVKTSVEGMAQVIERLTLSDSGCFFDYRGRELPY